MPFLSQDIPAMTQVTFIWYQVWSGDNNLSGQQKSSYEYWKGKVMVPFALSAVEEVWLAILWEPSLPPVASINSLAPGRC